MPFTPLHIGPGAAFKAVGGGHFSLTMFGLAQVVMDIEPLVRLLRGDTLLHGFTHTYAGATVIALLSLFLGKHLCEWLLRTWNSLAQASLSLPTGISWHSATAGAFIGTFSHVFLDSLMHADMQPLSPLNTSNPLLHRLPLDWLHLFCLFSGVGGLIIIAIRGSWRGSVPDAD